jgi:hypothetical protein
MAQKIQDTAGSSQDHEKCVLGLRRRDLCSFFPHGVTINVQYYTNLLPNDIHRLRRSDLGNSKIIMLLHKNSCPHMANLMKPKQATMGWEIMNLPPHSHDLAPSDFNFFGPMNVHLGGQQFQTDDELKCDVLNWLHIHDKALYAPVTCHDDGNNVLVQRENIVKRGIWRFWQVYSFCKRIKSRSTLNPLCRNMLYMTFTKLVSVLMLLVFIQLHQLCSVHHSYCLPQFQFFTIHIFSYSLSTLRTSSSSC